MSGWLRERVVELDLAVPADLAGMIGELEHRALAAHRLDHEVVDRHDHRAARAVGRGDRAAEAAAPGHDRNVGALGGVEAGADRGKGKHHVDDGRRAALGEILDRGVGLIGAAGGVDHRHVPAHLLGRSLGARDVAGVVGLGRRDRNDADEGRLRQRRADRKRGHRDRGADYEISSSLPSQRAAASSRAKLANRFAAINPMPPFRQAKKLCVLSHTPDI